MRCRGCSPTGTSCTSPATRAWPMRAPPASICPHELRPRYIAEPFLTDRMADALVAADLVVGRAGSSTCAELTAVGVASILVPYPFAGAHQRYNASYLGDEGAARVVADEDLDADRLVAEVAALRDDDRRAAMAEAARAAGAPGCRRGPGGRAAGDGRAAAAAVGDREHERDRGRCPRSARRDGRRARCRAADRRPARAAHDAARRRACRPHGRSRDARRPGRDPPARPRGRRAGLPARQGQRPRRRR